MTAQYVITRPPKNDDELWWSVRATWGVQIPRVRVCSHHDTPFEAFSHAYFARDPQAMWLGSRGFSGKTFTLSLLGLTEMCFLGAFVSVLGGSGAQALRVQESMNELWYADSAPRHLLKKAPTKYDTELTNEGKARTLMASQTSVRGPHPSRLRIDEIDEADLEIIQAALGQTMRRKSKVAGVGVIDTNTVFSSTHTYPDKTVTYFKKDFQEKGFPVFSWCLASGTMVLTARGEIPIEHLNREDQVLTRAGWRPVQHLTFMGYKRTVGLRVGTRVLRATPDHRVAVPSGWAHAGALAANAMASSRSDVGVPGRELVTLAAMGSSGLMLPSPLLVDGVGDYFQMLGVDARSVPAEMVDGHTVLDGSDYSLPDPDVGRDGRPLVVVLDSFDSVSGTFGSRPVETLSGEHGDLLPVWDIGVEGEHEFVAEGIVVHNCYKETAKKLISPPGSKHEIYDGWLEPDEVERKRLEIPIQMWRNEYDILEPNFEGRAIDEESVERMFDPDWDIVDDKEGYFFRFMRPQDDRDYVTGVDWAQKKDFTVIVTWDSTVLPWKMAAYERINRRRWPVMVNRLNKRWAEYGGVVVSDSLGIGNVINDYIEFPPGALREHLVEFNMAGRVRSDMITECVQGVENGSFLAPRLKNMYDDFRFVTPEDLYNIGTTSHLPDTIAATALAWTVRKNPKRGTTRVLSLTRDSSPWKI
jgi:hypothetical protein